MINLYKAFYNAVDYPMRQFFRWRRKNLIIANEEKDTLFSYLDSVQQIRLKQSMDEYLSRYCLYDLYSNSTGNNFKENLYYLELFENAAKRIKWSPGQMVKVADIGVADWFYIRALYSFVKNYPEKNTRSITLDGYEIDAYRVYTDAYSRFDYAMAYCKGLDSINYIPRSFQREPNSYDLIFMLFPFVFLHDHLKWGLPIRLFSPEHLLKDAWDSLKTKGVLVIVNQGSEEHERQMEMINSLNIDLYLSFPFQSDFYKYPLQRYVHCMIKHP